MDDIGPGNRSVKELVDELDNEDLFSEDNYDRDSDYSDVPEESDVYDDEEDYSNIDDDDRSFDERWHPFD